MDFQEELTALEPLMNHFPEVPGNYFHGLCPEASQLPQDIVFFLRTRGENLGPGNPIIHDRYNLLLNLEGSAHISLDQQELHFQPGQALLMFPCQLQIHEFVSPLKWGITGFSLMDGGGLESLRSRPIIPTLRALRAFRFALEHYRLWRHGSKEIHHRNLMGTYLFALLHELALPLEPEPVTLTHPPHHDGSHKAFLRNLSNAIPALGWTVGVEELAAQLNLSPSGLHRRTMKLLGQSPGQYILKQRMKFARQLLEESGLNVGQVALACEYATPGAFVRAFKAHHQCTPGAYRRR
ncbi:MAG: helix-turn-helix transcriptional regulator [Spirochaetales bacterium]|nr:helix-turn-helix transcriptional regulator [Spirochaetales bacterium]